jgi:hypothetical protein
MRFWDTFRKAESSPVKQAARWDSELTPQAMAWRNTKAIPRAEEDFTGQGKQKLEPKG